MPGTPPTADCRPRLLTRAASAGAIGVGLVVLFGWFADIPALKSVLPGLSTMKVNTALSFILTGVALWTLRGRLPIFVPYSFAMGTVVLAGLILVQHTTGRSLGIDEFLVVDRAPYRRRRRQDVRARTRRWPFCFWASQSC